MLALPCYDLCWLVPCTSDLCWFYFTCLICVCVAVSVAVCWPVLLCCCAELQMLVPVVPAQYATGTCLIFWYWGLLLLIWSDLVTCSCYWYGCCCCLDLCWFLLWCTALFPPSFLCWCCADLFVCVPDSELTGTKLEIFKKIEGPTCKIAGICEISFVTFGPTCKIYGPSLICWSGPIWSGCCLGLGCDIWTLPFWMGLVLWLGCCLRLLIAVFG